MEQSITGALRIVMVFFNSYFFCFNEIVDVFIKKKKKSFNGFFSKNIKKKQRNFIEKTKISLISNKKSEAVQLFYF